MSDGNAVDKLCCASCGIEEVDDIKLKECDACDLVRYCSDGCQREHKSQHEEACKKRAAELRDELLFRQPDSSHRGDCLICCLPMPLDRSKSTIMTCCSIVICDGCEHANQMREIEGKLQQTCPFCRKPTPSTVEEGDKQRMKRVEANDPVSMRNEGVDHYDKGDYSSAFECFTKSAELGDAEAHHSLALLYHKGHGVEKDRGKDIYHMEEAAIGGHPKARSNLAWHELKNDNIERAVKHLIVAATLGCDLSIKALMRMFKEGDVKKEVLAAALRAHQAAVDATKSPQREAAEQYRRT